MQFTFDQFKVINKGFNSISKHATGGDVIVDFSYTENYQIKYSVRYNKLSFKNIAKMHACTKELPIPLKTLICPGAQKNENFWKKLTAATGKDRTIQPITQDNSFVDAKSIKTLKLIPAETPREYLPKVILHDPIEVIEGDHTYRVLTGQNNVEGDQVRVICRHDEKMYDYLDKHFFIMQLRSDKKKGKDERLYVIANEYDINVAHIMAMCKIQPKLVENLKDKCFVNVYEAELTRLRLEKKLTVTAKAKYDKIKEAIDNDYKKNTTLIVVGKLMNNSVEKTTINNVVFTKQSAKYEQISIEAPDLMDVMYKSLNFNSEFDIYTVIEYYANHIQTKLDAMDGEGELPEFKVNNANMKIRVGKSFQRYINDIRINKDEISKAIHRASCYQDTNEYTLFLKSISRMSIKWHDIIANGLQVKIHDMEIDEMTDPKPGPAAPALKFFIDKQARQIKLNVSEDRGVRVNLSKLIKKVDTLNRRTNNNYINRGGWDQRYNRKNGTWCTAQMVPVLIECCTFNIKEKDANGNEVTKTECYITKDDITKLLQIANDAKKKAIERSKEFLDMSVKLTGAQKIEFMGKPAYKVAGGLREYAVVIENAKVYDFDTKQYRCIVNNHHYKGAGYDDIAARLLALKNDTVMVDQIGTLRGNAQPGAENAHNDYIPERDVLDGIEQLIDTELKEAVLK